MVKPQYRLQALLEIREREEKDKENEWLECKKKLLQEQQKEEELRKQHQDMKDNRNAKEQENFEKMRAGELNMNDYVNAERYIKRLDQEIEDFKAVIKQQEKKVVFADQEVGWAWEEFMEAKKALKALEKHKEKWEEEWKKEQRAKEEEAQEEVSMALYMFRDK